MATGNIRLPADDVGFRVPTRTFTEDSVEKHLGRRGPERAAEVAGHYYAHSGVLSVQATAHAATAGFCWLINPVGSAVKVSVEEMRASCGHPATTATATSPRFTWERVTFTGTASGASATIAKRRTTDAAPVASLRTASTGLTLAAVATGGSWLPVNQIAATSSSRTAHPVLPSCVFRDGEEIILEAGEGIVLRQPDAGTTTDPRRLFFDLFWAELTEEF